MYSIEGKYFVCKNGTNRYTRPLYGRPGLFYTYAGDRPEWSLSRPGKTGNLMIGIIRGKQRKWLINAETIVSKYCPGYYIHEISDPMLGKAKIIIYSIGMSDNDGLVVKVEVTARVKAMKMIWAFGGVREIESCKPIDFDTCGYTSESHFFPKPEDSDGNSIKTGKDSFILKVPFALGSPVQAPEVQATGKLYRKNYSGVTGAVYGDGMTKPKVISSKIMTDDMDFSSSVSKSPAVMGQWKPEKDQPIFLGIMMMPRNSSKLKASSLPKRFTAAMQRHEQIRNQITVKTPDSDLNAIVPALCSSMDSAWDPPYIVHGGIHCHTPYLGWRHAYGATALGWFNRAESHFKTFAGTQFKKTATNCRTPRMDEEYGLSRQAKNSIIHSRGFIWGHRDDPMYYNMQELFVDMILRQILYTGNLDFAREMYPVIEKHLEWEQRCFDRGGLYENFANTHISDAHQYNGAGGAQASAYTYYANLMMSRLAKILGKNDSKFSKEAIRIKKAMNRLLWMKNRGAYAECNDIIGLKRRNESPELPSIYHPIDSEVTDMFKAYEMIQYTECSFEQVLCGKNRGHMVWSSNWVPWFWSTRQLMLNENGHLSLAAWQAGCKNEAYDHFMGATLNSMLESRCVAGCIGTSPLDTHHPGLSTDFSCGTGITCRALIEGLFGFQPNLLDKEIRIHPGFPDEWDSASLTTPYGEYDYQKNKNKTTIKCTFKQPVSLTLELPYSYDESPEVLVNGVVVKHHLNAVVGEPLLIIKTKPGCEFHCEIHRKGNPLKTVSYHPIAVAGEPLRGDFKGLKIEEYFDPQECVAEFKGKQIIICHHFGHHTFFVKVRQNAVSWWQPFNIEIRPPVELIDPEYCKFENAVHATLRNNLTGKERNTVINWQIPPLVPGTYSIQTKVKSQGEKFFAKSRVPIWNLPGKVDPDDFQTIDISSKLNLDIAAIFQQEYRFPRSPYCSLSLPFTGYGEWCAGSKRQPPKLDSLYFTRRIDEQKRFITPQGIPFHSPHWKEEDNNAVILSQWDNFPSKVNIPVDNLHAGRLYFLVTGSANPMYSQMDVARLIVHCKDGSAFELPLHSPDNFWPIWGDFDTAADAFCLPENPPQRVLIGENTWANLLDMEIPEKTITSIEFECLANETVVGLLGMTAF